MNNNSNLPVLVALLASCLMLAGCKEQNITVRINNDGSCVVLTEYVVLRAQMEQQVKMMDQGGFDDEDDPEEGGEGETGNKDPDGGVSRSKSEKENLDEKAAKAEELAAKIREMYGENTAFSQMLQGTMKVDTVEVGEETVKMKIVTSFDLTFGAKI